MARNLCLPANALLPDLAIQEKRVHSSQVQITPPEEDQSTTVAKSLQVMVRRFWIPAALILILAIGAYFRFTGINWDQDQHQHPDERFMTMVAEQIRPVGNLAEYLDAERSSLNPLGYGFYTYGMWPLFLTRYIAEWANRTGYNEIVLVGRVLSGLFDLASVLLLYLLGARLYGRRVGLLAAALYAAAVLPIQLSHFFAVDSFTTLFTIAAIYAAVLVMEQARWWAFALFGVSTGLALAAKVSIAPLAGLVVVAGLAYLLPAWSEPEARKSRLQEVLGGWVIAALCTVWFFRVFQPYAFLGPGLFGIRLNPRWLEIIRGVSDQVAGRSDFPPNHHWAGRPFSYGWTNMVQWGMGLPLGLAATAAWGWAVWRSWKGEWRRHLLLVLWVGGFTLWQSTNFWRYTRYFLPIYPFAILLTAWALVELVRRARTGRVKTRRATAAAILAAVLLAGVVASTYAYAYAFTRIYTRPHTRVAASRWIYQNLPGPINVLVETPEGTRQIPLSMPDDLVLRAGEPWSASFTPGVSGTVTGLTVPHIGPAEPGGSTASLDFKLREGGVDGQPLAVASMAVDLESSVGMHSFALAPTAVDAGQEYSLALDLRDGSPLAFRGAAIAVETGWDDALPLAVDGYNPYAGIYQPLDLELQEAETESKRERMAEILDQAEYVVIASNRTYDAMPRLPQRFPLTVAFYQALFGCESEQISDCAYPAVAPQEGALGFDLVATFESYPTLGPFSFPDQTAQESFTVYDHPKVLVFAKAPDYSPAQVRDVLGAVDLDQVVEQTAVQVSQMPTGLRLSAARLAVQEAAGTWSALFSGSSVLNQSQFLAVVAWLLLLLLAGWIAFPLSFAAFAGLSDRGYALARLVGLLVVGWLAWFAASYQVLAFTGATLWLCLGLMGLPAAIVAWLSRASLIEFLRARWRHILFVEGLFLALFLFGLLLRWYNPDLWHPFRGGEKPGDLALFNAVLKSVAFPPYDPWLAGHHVNYYYYGYVLAAIPTKLLGIAPAVAYNLLLPTWYALTGLGAFTVAFNLVARQPSSATGAQTNARGSKAPYVAGMATLVLMVLLGNLFEIQLLWERVVVGGAEMLGGDKGLWYFDASRAILNVQQSAPITEFPFFTFLYADLHPHLLDMPIVLGALAWMLSFLYAPVLVSRAASLGKSFSIGATWLLGGLLFGATYPTNTWDFPVIVGLGLFVVGYAVWGASEAPTRVRIERLVLHVGLLLVLAIGLYLPFRQSFGTGARTVELWTGPRTPLADYLTVHGLFLFVVVTFLVVETARWLRPSVRRFIHTPLGELVPAIKRGSILLLGGLTIGLAGLAWSWVNDYQAVALALPLAVWAGLLLLRPGQTRNRRFVLLLILAGIGLTVVAELVTLQGDVGRMNVVFKSYLLVWMFLSIAAGAALVWLRPHFGSGERRWLWWGMLGFLVFAASTYPAVGILAKVQDRWPDIANPPKTLDGMAFMLGDATGAKEGKTTVMYRENDVPLHLAEDHAALRWLQENIAGTPTIVEGHTSEYRWGSRFANYTGLPTIVGWNWHLRQHNAVLPASVVEKRIEALNSFYNTTDDDEARRFLDRYQADYVIVGDLERARYSAEGLEKFERLATDGTLAIVYPENDVSGEVTIYAVQRGAPADNGPASNG